MPLEVNVDALSLGDQNISTQSTVAQRLMQTGFQTSALRTLGVLRKEEWIQFDEALIQIARQRLVGVGDLLSAGLRFDIANALGTTRLEWERISDMEPAELSMSGVKEGEVDRVTFDLQSIPLPIIHKDFNINIRALEASRKLGQPLDTTQVQLSTRLVTEKVEDILFNGATIASTNGTIFGYLNAPDRSTGALTKDWTTATGEEILANVISMTDGLRADNMYGPYAMYIPQTYWGTLQDDFKANSDRSTIERLMALSDISFIHASSNITGNNVIMVQLTSDVVQEVVGMEPTVLEWEGHGGMVSYFKVMAIMVPRIRSDLAAQSGVAHYSV